MTESVAYLRNRDYTCVVDSEIDGVVPVEALTKSEPHKRGVLFVENVVAQINHSRNDVIGVELQSGRYAQVEIGTQLVA